MREYNLFVIKKEYFNLYKKRPLYLFNILQNLFYFQNNFNYGVTLYEQLCNRINIYRIKEYLNDKYDLECDKYFHIDKVLIELKPSRIILKSKCNLPRIMKSFNCYNRYIFVCDFINEDYFWLNEVCLQYI